MAPTMIQEALSDEMFSSCTPRTLLFENALSTVGAFTSNSDEARKLCVFRSDKSGSGSPLDCVTKVVVGVGVRVGVGVLER